MVLVSVLSVTMQRPLDLWVGHMFALSQVNEVVRPIDSYTTPDERKKKKNKKKKKNEESERCQLVYVRSETTTVIQCIFF